MWARTRLCLRVGLPRFDSGAGSGGSEAPAVFLPKLLLLFRADQTVSLTLPSRASILGSRYGYCNSWEIEGGYNAREAGELLSFLK